MTVQPVLDRYCIGCHGLDRTEGDLDLVGTIEPVTFPRQQWPGPNKMLAPRAYAALDHHDVAGTCGRPDRCECDCCWVRKQNGLPAEVK